MIETIIKRDGREEPFEPNKINGWGEWASNNIPGGVNWSEVVIETTRKLPNKCTSEQLQMQLIEECKNQNSWKYQRMAGRLFTALWHKELLQTSLHERHKQLVEAGLLSIKILEAFSPEEYTQLNGALSYEADYNMALYQLHQYKNKYCLQNRKTGKVMETPQEAMMRVAMGLLVNIKKDRIERIIKTYTYISQGKLNVPTPYYVNVGTNDNGYLSCCVYHTKDTANSLATGDHIGYMMTVNSAGIGAGVVTRSIGDPVRGGAIEHQGKLPYYLALTSAVRANLQNGRGGAVTITYTAFDPEIETLLKLKNQNTPIDRANRDADYSFAFNDFFVRKANKSEKYWTFSVQTAPGLFEALYQSDSDDFEQLYNRYVEMGLGVKELDARAILKQALTEGLQTGRIYLFNINESNRHTPFKDSVHLSNLCQEISLPTKAFDNVTELYSPQETTGEVAMCALGGVAVSRILSDEEYADVAFYALLMIDQAISLSSYALPNIAFTANQRRSAGVGIVGLAEYLAQRKLKYGSQEARDEVYELFEAHYYHLLNASIELSKELGRCPWGNRLKAGWLPLDTYNKNVDELVTTKPKRDWDTMRKLVKEHGVRNSTLVAIMPAESSSIASGLTNGVYPIQSFSTMKTNQRDAIPYVVPNDDLPYEIKYDVNNIDMIKMYAVMQAWVDQGISSNLWVDLTGDKRKSTNELLLEFFTAYKYGLKTRYYYQSKTSKDLDLDKVDTVITQSTRPQSDDTCTSCTL